MALKAVRLKYRFTGENTRFSAEKFKAEERYPEKGNQHHISVIVEGIAKETGSENVEEEQEKCDIIPLPPQFCQDC